MGGQRSKPTKHDLLIDGYLESCYDLKVMQERKQGIFSRFWAYLRRESQWLRIGLGYKRWLLLVLLGTTLLGLGLALILLHIYRTVLITGWCPFWRGFHCAFRPPYPRVVIFGGIGVILVLIGVWGANQVLI